MGLAPEKASRINTHYDRTASVGADPWSIVFRSSTLLPDAMDLGSVIIDCGDKHYNTGITPGYLYVMQWEASWLPA